MSTDVFTDGSFYDDGAAVAWFVSRRDWGIAKVSSTSSHETELLAILTGANAVRGSVRVYNDAKSIVDSLNDDFYGIQRPKIPGRSLRKNEVFQEVLSLMRSEKILSVTWASHRTKYEPAQDQRIAFVDGLCRRSRRAKYLMFREVYGMHPDVIRLWEEQSDDLIKDLDLKMQKIIKPLLEERGRQRQKISAPQIA